MRFSFASILAVAAAVAEIATASPTKVLAARASTPTTGYMAGFNLGAQNTDNSCKTTAQWQSEFTTIKSWGSQFTTIKLYSTSDCGALLAAVPAAINAGVKLWVGVWEIDDAKFGAEKAALQAAIQKYGAAKWLAGVNVGSEALYRKEITANDLAQKIYDVKGMVQISLKASKVPVGSADTWTSWVDGANKPVIDASDVILMNGFPYWQGSAIQDSFSTFKTAIANTKAAIGSKPFFIGETGWPTAGANFGTAKPDIANAQTYWKQAACYLQSQKISWFWFSAFDEPQKASGVEQHFGVAYAGRTPKISFTC